MAESSPRAKRHTDYVQVMPLRTPSPRDGAPSLQTFAEEHVRADLSEPEPDGYVRISKEQAEELVKEIDDYANSWGPLLEVDKTLATELRAVLDTWE